jgi:hypothetical protein
MFFPPDCPKTAIEAIGGLFLTDMPLEIRYIRYAHCAEEIFCPGPSVRQVILFINKPL